MKKLLIAALLALPLLALTSPARAGGNGGLVIAIPFTPLKVDSGFDFHVRLQEGGPAGQAGPWYLYWPLEAHFGPPAPTGFPFWPSQMTLPPDGHGHGHGHYPSMVPAPAHAQAPRMQANPIRPVGYQAMPNYLVSE